MAKELEKQYNPHGTEDRIYEMWENGGYFTPSGKKGKPYSIVIPPPNVTGQLHMGHALDDTLQDILIRYKRMNGFDALWVPGTDHAGIATQIKVEEMLRKEENLTRYDLGREKFLERVWAWKEMYGNRIINQLKKLGCSCDWTRERFTMDEGCSKAVKEVFVNLYDKGLIYRGHRIANWCPRCKTALSDAEVDNPEQNGFYWHIKYFVKDSDEYVVVATTRPETLFGDTAVAVNPEDDRYKALVGKCVVVPFVNREIPIITDEYADIEKGTGCVKITPAHDPNDFLVGQRHDLEQINVMNDDATLNEIAVHFCGMDRYEARKKIVEELEEMGVLVKVEPTVHNVGECYRCGTTVEPLISDQWFVKMEPLAKPAIDIVRDGTIKFIPENQSKKYFNWMENIHDWCISRQLWWGHRIPAYYCDTCGYMEVSKTDVEVCPKCGKPMRQDEDVLDTWFSSALWPFSTLGWPEQTEDLEKYYPTSTLVTGYDIITFWVSRMIFSGVEHTGKEPFDTVLIHGLVRDELGRKMSKSLGNGVDPLEVIDKYGADALRFTLITGNSPGNDMRYSDKKVEASRAFANKIWNAARFVLLNLDDDTKAEIPEKLELEDKWILSHLNTTIKEMTSNLDKFELGVAAKKLYDFIWDYFCDWYIELVKPRLFAKGTETNKTAQQVITYVLSNTLKLLHPYMPYISEEIWQTLAISENPLIIADWPLYDEKFDFASDAANLDKVIDAIGAIRLRRAEMNVPPSKKAKLIIVSDYKESFNTSTAVFFEKLAGASEVVLADGCDDDTAVSIVTDSAKLFIPMAEIIDIEKEKARLEKEKSTTISEIERVNKKLSNNEFVAKAPAAVIDGEKAKLEKYTQMLANIEEAIAKLLK
ncbi:MAG: valine--tRNA ligase [Ruminococcaceae bacterium]|nr:valine--tRNA ligase [Oscillospiraceae bacterium]